MRNISISDSSVRESIKRLNKKKASGPNKMPITFLIHVQTINIITPVISVIFQQSLDRGEISANWKNAKIVPIYKKGDRTTPANYRPVSLRAAISKLLEHTIVFQILDHLNRAYILHESYRFNMDSVLDNHVNPKLLMTINWWYHQTLRARKAIWEYWTFQKHSTVPHICLLNKLQ